MIAGSEHRVALIRRPSGRPRPEDDFTDAIVERFVPDVVFEQLPTEPGDIDSLREMDAVIVFWPDRCLLETDPLGFEQLAGRIAKLEHDAFGNFTTWGTRLHESWATTFHRHGFDVLVCNGHIRFEQFTQLGIETMLVYKGVSTDRFCDFGRVRAAF